MVGCVVGAELSTVLMHSEALWHRALAPRASPRAGKGAPPTPSLWVSDSWEAIYTGWDSAPSICRVPNNIDTDSVGPRAELYPALFFQGCCSLTETGQSGHLAHNWSTANRDLLGSSQTALRGKIQQLFHHLIPTYTLLLDRAQITVSLLHSRRTHAPSSGPQRRSLLPCCWGSRYPQSLQSAPNAAPVKKTTRSNHRLRDLEMATSNYYMQTLLYILQSSCDAFHHQKQTFIHLNINRSGIKKGQQ